MARPVCCICQKSLHFVPALYRVNSKGVPGIYACKEHLPQTDAPKPDEELEDIVNVVSGQSP